MKLIHLIMLFVACSTYSYCFSQPLTLAADHAWFPYYGPNLPDDGPILEITKEAFKRAGYDTEVHYMPWTRAMKEVELLEKDVLVGVYYSDERAEKYIFSEAFHEVKISLYAHDSLGVTHYNNLKKLKPYTIGVIQDFAYDDEFDHARYLNKTAVTNGEQVVQMFVNGRTDIIANNNDSFEYYRTRIKPNFNNYIELFPPLSINEVHITISKRHKEAKLLMASFNKAIIEMEFDGTLEKIKSKHNLSIY